MKPYFRHLIILGHGFSMLICTAKPKIVVEIMASCFVMDIFTLNPHNISYFGETGGHNMDFCCIKEASKKLFGMYLKRGKIVFFKNNVIYFIFVHL